jgi:hypothetical protein
MVMGNNSKWDKLSKEELIDVVKEYSLKIGRIPKKEDMKKKLGSPSACTIKTCFGVNSWSEVLSICGLEVTTIHKYSEEFGLSKLKEYYNILGRIPTKEEFKENRWKPTFTWYANNYGSIKEASFKAGLIEKPITVEERIAISIEELKDIAKSLNKCPTLVEYDTFKERGYAMGNLCEHLNMTYNEINIKYIPEYNLNKDTKKYDKTELLGILIDFKAKLGHTPSWDEFVNEKSIPDYSTYNIKFNKTYNEILHEELNWECKIRKTDDELLDDFYNIVKRIKRIPTTKDYQDENGAYCASSYINRFGSISNVFTLLGMDYTLFTNCNCKSGVVCFDNNGNLTKSFIERYVNNLFIENDIYFDREIYYNELLECDKTKRRFDWRIKTNGKTYYVEYFGMYEAKSKSDIIRKYKKKTKKKIKDICKYNKINDCIFLFKPKTGNYRLICLEIKDKLEKILNVELSENNNILEINSYSDMTDAMLLEQTMKYSDNQEYLPSASYLGSYRSDLYKEIKNRYGNLYTFSQISNKKVLYKSQGYYTKEIVFKLFDNLMATYDKIPSRKEITKIGNNEFKFKGLVGICYNNFGGWLNIKIEYYMQYAEKYLYLPKESIKELSCIAYKKHGFYNIKEEQQFKIQGVLERIENKVIS